MEQQTSDLMAMGSTATVSNIFFIFHFFAFTPGRSIDAIQMKLSMTFNWGMGCSFDRKIAAVLVPSTRLFKRVLASVNNFEMVNSICFEYSIRMSKLFTAEK